MVRRTRLVTVLAVLFLVGGCTSDDGAADEPTTTAVASTTTAITTTTQAPPSTAAATTTTEAVPVVPMTLTFDGEGCTFDGPTELTPGPVEYTFVNESEVLAVQNFVEVLEGKTHEVMIAYNGPEPFNGQAPSWTRDLGTWSTTGAGVSRSWTKHLEPGSYFMVCGQARPLLAWNGPWLTVAAGSGDTSDQIEGTWLNDGFWVQFDEGFQFMVAQNSDVKAPILTGTYTFDGETLTMANSSSSSNCPDKEVTFTVVFSADGDEAALTFVEDSCLNSPRSTDQTLIRHSS